MFLTSSSIVLNNILGPLYKSSSIVRHPTLPKPGASPHFPFSHIPSEISFHCTRRPSQPINPRPFRSRTMFLTSSLASCCMGPKWTIYSFGRRLWSFVVQGRLGLHRTGSGAMWIENVSPRVWIGLSYYMIEVQTRSDTIRFGTCWKKARACWKESGDIGRWWVVNEPTRVPG